MAIILVFLLYVIGVACDLYDGYQAGSFLAYILLGLPLFFYSAAKFLIVARKGYLKKLLKSKHAINFIAKEIYEPIGWNTNISTIVLCSVIFYESCWIFYSVDLQNEYARIVPVFGIFFIMVISFYVLYRTLSLALSTPSKKPKYQYLASGMVNLFKLCILFLSTAYLFAFAYAFDDRDLRCIGKNKDLKCSYENVGLQMNSTSANFINSGRADDFIVINNSESNELTKLVEKLLYINNEAQDITVTACLPVEKFGASIEARDIVDVLKEKFHGLKEGKNEKAIIECDLYKLLRLIRITELAPKKNPSDILLLSDLIRRAFSIDYENEFYQEAIYTLSEIFKRVGYPEDDSESFASIGENEVDVIALVLKNILFSLGPLEASFSFNSGQDSSPDLTNDPDYQAILKTIIKLGYSQEITVYTTGHTTDDGNYNYNISLSSQRALKVQTQLRTDLKDRFGYNTPLIKWEAVGLGHGRNIKSADVEILISLNPLTTIGVSKSVDAPASFPISDEPSILDYLYFSIYTISTSAYGDIFPVSPFAKFLTSIENLIEIYFVTIFFGLIVSSLLSLPQVTSLRPSK